MAPSFVKRRKLIYTPMYFPAFLLQKHVKIVYFTLVGSTLTDGICVYSDSYNSNLELLNVTQTWILNITMNKPKDLKQRSEAPL